MLIASPSDVEEERELAVQVIQQWNDLHSYSRQVTLLPLRWETHTAPEYGTRPQAVINRAIVDECDLLIGIFWTRIGTPTGEADSGTLEEIARVAKAGKPVMLYFSKIGVDPDLINLSQLERLNTFKKETHSIALTESYKSHVDFRDKFARQLELKMRDLQKADQSGQSPPLTLAVRAGDSGYAGEVRQTVDLLRVCDLDSVLREKKDAARHENEIRTELAKRVNEPLIIPVSLAIRNTGTSGIRNLYVQVSIKASSDRAQIFDLNPYDRREGPLAWIEDSLKESLLSIDPASDPPIKDEGWTRTFEWNALQPQRDREDPHETFLRTTADCHFDCEAKVFADNFPSPVLLTAKVFIAVQPREVKVSDLIPGLETFLKSKATVERYVDQDSLQEHLHRMAYSLARSRREDSER